MNFLKKIFNKKISLPTFEEQVRKEIYECEKSIFEYETDIHKIRNWGAELIHQTFKVPQKYWYEELKYLEKIINLPENKNIAPEIAEDVKNISLSYKQQLMLRKMKVEVCAKNKQQLQEMLINEKEINKQLHNEQTKQNYIEKHKKKAKTIQQTDISTEIIITERVKAMKNQIFQMQDELKLKQEFNKQLQKLYRKYGETNDIKSTKIYHEELKKILDTTAKIK